MDGQNLKTGLQSRAPSVPGWGGSTFNSAQLRLLHCHLRSIVAGGGPHRRCRRADHGDRGSRVCRAASIRSATWSMPCPRRITARSSISTVLWRKRHREIPLARMGEASLTKQEQSGHNPRPCHTVSMERHKPRHGFDASGPWRSPRFGGSGPHPGTAKIFYARLDVSAITNWGGGG
jgi:hypothetical protein